MFRLVARPEADLEIAAVFEWYEDERQGLGDEFLDELRAVYDRIEEGPFKYRTVFQGLRRALTRRFPYAVYFAVEEDAVVILAVLHVARDPAEW